MYMSFVGISVLQTKNQKLVITFKITFETEYIGFPGWTRLGVDVEINKLFRF